MLPLGVVIPTRNSRTYLAQHVEGLRPWLSFATEVVVVDSDSMDGTVEFLRENLKHPCISFLHHPPGLYASWNHGIAQVSAPFVHIATIGDTITREGIETLVRAAESLACDVVVSKPDFHDTAGATLPNIPWPVDDIIATLGVTAPRRLHKLEAIVFAAVHVTGALTGSCASCVYRTDALRQFPFPPEFGTVGDGAWGVMHAAEVAWVVVPGRFSTFLKHPPSVTAVDQRSYTQARRMDEVLREAAARWQCQGLVTPSELERIRWDELLQSVTAYLDAKGEFDRLRRGRIPWIIQPAAWRWRTRRECASWRLNQLKLNALQRMNRCLVDV